MPRPCACGNVTGPEWSAGQCRLCWLAEYDPRYRRLWGPAPPPCRHLGPEVGREECATCAGRVVLKLYECRAGHAGPGGRVRPGRECKGCPDYAPPDPPPAHD